MLLPEVPKVLQPTKKASKGCHLLVFEENEDAQKGATSVHQEECYSRFDQT